MLAIASAAINFESVVVFPCWRSFYGLSGSGVGGGGMGQMVCVRTCDPHDV